MALAGHPNPGTGGRRNTPCLPSKIETNFVPTVSFAMGIADTDVYASSEVLLAFTHRGRQVQLRASAKGWAALYLKAEPWKSGRRGTRHDYEQKALAQGHIAVNSILRDWIKGSVAAVEAGILSFDSMFMPFMIGADGRPLLERAIEMLPKPEEAKVVALPGRG